MANGRRHVARDDADWQLGTASDVAWVDEATSTCLAITSAIPPVFDAYATIVVPGDGEDLERQEQAMIALLSEQSPDRPWWLGYLETGADDIVFPEAQRVQMYADWGYVLVQAGPEQAAHWRGDRFHRRRMPDLIFPVDRSWLLSTLWDDDWTCVGGPVRLVESLLHHPDLAPWARPVKLDEDATPPGHTAI